MTSARPGSGTSTAGRAGYAGDLSRDVVDLSNVDLSEVPRLTSTFAEFDRVLGGGLVPGSAVLLGGNPGAGKSTLLLQTACKLAQQRR
ncbi:MAG TPA: DNA repair protein RadA, partial [Halomonas sp.]|nr:DNA repair protein RadA [Halomonas sp.]